MSSGTDEHSEIRCIACGGKKPSSSPKYCKPCAIQTKRRQSRGKKKEYRIEIKDYDKGDRLEYKKLWRKKRNWNKYMKRYRRENAERIRVHNRAASKRYRNKARQ